jgi:hemerythrin-like domain-containing protein
MLTEFITKRFSKHHSRVLAYMDALEEAVRDISDSPSPRLGFAQHRRLLNEFLNFIEQWEVPHEQEEERILLPVLEQRLRESADPHSAAAMLQVCRDHDRGGQLADQVRELFRELDERRPVEASGYYDLTSVLTDLIWHFRRHIWEEDSIILPTAERLIPPSDRIWASGAARRARE